MDIKELANSIMQLTSCINRIYDNGCLFDNIIFKMNDMNNELELLRCQLKSLTSTIEEIDTRK